mgnify:CR=1 FL=1
MDEEYQALVQQAIDSLPPKCREVFRLVLSDKLKNREIADILGISEKTVNIHIAKAYERIAEFVNRRYKEGGIKWYSPSPMRSEFELDQHPFMVRRPNTCRS